MLRSSGVADKSFAISNHFPTPATGPEKVVFRAVDVRVFFEQVLDSTKIAIMGELLGCLTKAASTFAS